MPAKRYHKRIERKILGFSLEKVHEIKDAFFLLRGFFHRENLHENPNPDMLRALLLYKWTGDPRLAVLYYVLRHPESPVPLIVWMCGGDPRAGLSSILHDLVDFFSTQVKRKGSKEEEVAWSGLIS